MTPKRERSTPKQVRGQAVLALNGYAVVARAVEEGVGAGWRRAHKHTARPDDASACEAIEHEVLNALSEVVLWP